LIKVLGLVTLGTALLVPAAAQGATRDVNLGLTAAQAKVFNPLGADSLDFFPHTTTINVGDSVRFLAPQAGFHNADIPAKSAAPVSLLAPNGTKVSGAKDAAGADFWFNGQDNIGFNPGLFAGSFGKKVSYNGSKGVNSGLPLSAKVKPMTVKFTKAGTVKYFCDIHPGMEGVVKVLGKGKRIPSNKAHKNAAKKQAARDLVNAKTLAKTPVPDNEISVGVKGKNGVEALAFLPDQKTVAVGSTVTFKIPNKLREVHTATAGPGDPGNDPKGETYLGQIAKTFEGAPVIDPRGIYPSETPPTTARLTPSLHGNGFWNTGVLDAVGASLLPQSSQVTFGQAGTYTFYCLIHPFMKATVTAQ
jgi:plastocyanin